VSPLAVPVLLEIGRESVRTDTDEEALLAEAEAIIAEATGAAAPEPGAAATGAAGPRDVPAIHRANAARRPTGAKQTRLPRAKPPRTGQADLFS
jgi:ATP-dependent Lhr-like helicase